MALAGPAARDGSRDTYWRFYPRLADGRYGRSTGDEIEIFRAIAARREEPRAEREWDSPGPTEIDWELIGRASTELAEQLTRERSTAQIAAGGSERSRKIRTELRAGLDGLDIERVSDLLERLLQVRAEDFDARSGWRRFDDARRRLRRAKTLGERREAGLAVVEDGLELFGAPVDTDAAAIGPVEVKADQIQLVAYEALVRGPAAPPAVPSDTASLFE